MVTREELEARDKKCSRCGEVKPGTDYSIAKKANGTLSLMARCKPCRSVTFKEYRESNPAREEYYRAYSKEYGQTYERTPEAKQRIADATAEHMKNSQSDSLERATNNYKEWTGPELELLLRDDLTAVQLAEMLNRTYASVRRMRAKCLRDPRKQTLAGIERGEL